MTHDIAFLEKVYERMHQAGLVESKVEFSTRMLGKGPSYLTSMSARDRNVPQEVVAHLRDRIAADINDIDIQAGELEEQLRRCKLEQAHRREMVGWIAEDGCPAEPGTGRKARLLANWLDIVRSSLAPSVRY
ncbi:hypothetical protein NXC14_CH03388 [Rhizobium sp. NXC14]|uniref:DUF6626 family protein n=1 Tax=Rhizobium sp. NXC14 TaxID=1981173 RepID=UPI000A205D99|nr:DUF6626 family protein [Rhizobium sp. NXC14]ARO31292.1 hypothetical protein NXC14_CH03388 [Rhizobium sp. NXC14]